MDLSSEIHRPVLTPPTRSSPVLHVADHFTTSHATGFNTEDNVLPNQVGTAILHNVPIVSLFIDGKERLCLAQISNTLLKDFSYNEIHNRRVALGITCVQCTPVQLEVLRRAGAMPISSRRCGMITKREAERLVKSFLEEHRPPKLPDNFAFRVKHTCGWGCYGQFVPARYNSSRAKCIKCNFCNLFFSPNKFIFHFHRMPDANYRHPDAANFNSWRRHLLLDYDNLSDDLTHAWEDVKAMFNGGSRKRIGGSLPENCTEQDNTFIPKRRCFPMEPNMMFNKKAVHHSPYPVLPISNLVANPSNMMFPFNMPQTYPMLPPAEDKDTEERTKCQMIDVWKNKTPSSSICHPLGLLWAKSFGMYPFHNNLNISSAAEWNRRMTTSKPQKSMVTERDDRFSAFKPVGMLGSRIFGDSVMPPVPLQDVASTSRWWGNLPKSTYRCSASTFDATPSSAETEHRDPLLSEFSNEDVHEETFRQEIEECMSDPESEVCIEDTPAEREKVATPQETIQPAQSPLKDELEDEIDIGRKDDEIQTPTVDESPEPTTLDNSSIYQMSKEELQHQLLRMMKKE